MNSDRSTTASDSLLIAGLCLLNAGLWRAWEPLGWIGTGSTLVLLALALSPRGGNR